MIVSVELTTSFDETKDNAVRFNDEEKLRSAIARHSRPFSSFRCWYYFADIDVFAPSKFIGYKDAEIDDYWENAYEDKDGRNTEPELHEWFEKLTPDSPRYKQLRKKLDDLADRVGGKINVLVDERAYKEESAGIYVKA